ncbi:hypothetical protein HDK77DRAFT_483906 [Phyllosticta capitalensis]
MTEKIESPAVQVSDLTDFVENDERALTSTAASTPLTEAQSKYQRLCPFTEVLPTELVALIAENFDKKGLLAFRSTNLEIANRVEDAFKKSFSSVQYNL